MVNNILFPNNGIPFGVAVFILTGLVSPIAVQYARENPKAFFAALKADSLGFRLLLERI